MDGCAHTSSSGAGGVAGGSGSGQDEYDLTLHVAAVAIMFLVSLAGALAPVALRLSSSGAGVSALTRLGTYFGGWWCPARHVPAALPPAAGPVSGHLSVATSSAAPTIAALPRSRLAWSSCPRPAPFPTDAGFGTILATALIHMLPPAAQSLASPCLPAFFIGGEFHAWAYLFLLLAVLIMHMVDYLIKVGQGGRGAGPTRGVGDRARAGWAWHVVGSLVEVGVTGRRR